ncbi:hypothetical protein B0H19DRAFT_1240223 [Mycena capillaripes]|nr:hypothetical protein B0H19DRAFT_1240223 [Mycena capillaripes]
MDPPVSGRPENSVKAGTATPTTRDIGGKLIAYTREELDRIVRSAEYCDVVAPIAPNLTSYLLLEREKIAAAEEKKKEDEKAAKEKTPSWTAAIRFTMHPSIFWFTDDRLRFANEHPSDIPVKKNMGITAATEKTLLDCAELMKILGSDDSVEGISTSPG